MTAHLTVISEHFSEQVSGSDGRPVDLSETTLPRDADAPAATRLADAIERAVQEMRIRLRSTPAGGAAPLRLAVVSTTAAGTGMEIETASLALQEVEFQSEAGRKQVLEALRELERAVLS